MGLDNFIETAMNKVLKNPIVEVLRDINFSSILKQSNFKKRDIGVKPYMIILQFAPADLFGQSAGVIRTVLK